MSAAYRPSRLRTALILAAAGLCAAFGSTADPHPHPPWGYDDDGNPAQWSGIAPACAGPQQSPINLWSRSVLHRDQHELDIDYQATWFDVMNNGHTLQASPMPGSDNEIELNGETFELRQFHLHTPSEHHVDGRAHDMELHLVHASASGKVAVVAVLFDVGEPHMALAELFDRSSAELGRPGDAIPLYATLDPATLLPDRSRVVHYAGSLTTPPCTEGVLRSIEMEPQQISQQQLDALRFVFPHNARPIQAFNERTLVDEPAR